MNYVTYDPATGALTGSYTAQEPAEGEVFIEVTPEQQAAWTLYRVNDARDGLELLPPAPAPGPAPRHVTVYAFRRRFTQAEKVRIDLASIDNPAAPTEQRMLSASIRVMLADLAAAGQRPGGYIDLDLAETRAGVIDLQAAGLLDAEGRALQILDAEIQDADRA